MTAEGEGPNGIKDAVSIDERAYYEFDRGGYVFSSWHVKLEKSSESDIESLHFLRVET